MARWYRDRTLEGIYLKEAHTPFCGRLNWLQASTQRHLLRDRQHGTTVCPAFWGMGINEVK
jgi:hypothetical protein